MDHTKLRLGMSVFRVPHIHQGRIKDQVEVLQAFMI